jgi:signal transduction histidine kinase
MLTATDAAPAVRTGSDVRDALAASRIFLAWNRPALLLIAGAIVVAASLKLTFGGVQPIAALPLAALAASTSLSSYRLWQRARRAAMSSTRAQAEQAALRRMVALIARETSPDEVCAGLAEDLGLLLSVGATTMVRYEPDETVSVIASWGDGEIGAPDIASLVHRSGRPARTRAAVGAPIVVDGRLWGAMVAVTRQARPLPVDTERRIEAFTELVAAAISNVEARSELAASRARTVAAADAERRRVVRDLHDGAQQRLVHTVIMLKLARQALEDGEATAPALVVEALDHAQHATEELRELSHGVLPAVLTHGGLCSGIGAVASRMSLPVEVDVAVDRLPAEIEATAYFVVAEALTNVAKHASANGAAVTARVEDDTLRIVVRDDGVGGARPDGSGLVGLADRLAALDGRLRVDTVPERGTRVAADIPLRTR